MRTDPQACKLVGAKGPLVQASGLQVCASRHLSASLREQQEQQLTLACVVEAWVCLLQLELDAGDPCAVQRWCQLGMAGLL